MVPAGHIKWASEGLFEFVRQAAAPEKPPRSSCFFAFEDEESAEKFAEQYRSNEKWCVYECGADAPASCYQMDMMLFDKVARMIGDALDVKAASLNDSFPVLVEIAQAYWLQPRVPEISEVLVHGPVTIQAVKSTSPAISPCSGSGLLGFIQDRLVDEANWLPGEVLWNEITRSPAVERVEFVGFLQAWGSAQFVGLVRADGISDSEIPEIFSAFATIVREARRSAQSVFGTLCFIFDEAADPRTASLISKQKYKSFWRNIYAVSWILEGSTRQVHTHSGIPWYGMPPGKQYVEQVLTQYPGTAGDQKESSVR